MAANTLFVHGMQPGTILVSTWGYDQTNVTYYRVEKATAKTVMLVRLLSNETPADHNFMVGTSMPRTDETVNKPFRRRVKNYELGYYVKIESYALAHVWDGKPTGYTAYA